VQVIDTEAKALGRDEIKTITKKALDLAQSRQHSKETSPEVATFLADTTVFVTQTIRRLVGQSLGPAAPEISDHLAPADIAPID
jgi:hypothetical protein